MNAEDMRKAMAMAKLADELAERLTSELVEEMDTVGSDWSGRMAFGVTTISLMVQNIGMAGATTTRNPAVFDATFQQVVSTLMQMGAGDHRADALEIVRLAIQKAEAAD